MALDASRLGTAIATALRSAMLARAWVTDNQALTDFCSDLSTSIAAAIVTEITTNADVDIDITTGALQTSTTPGAATGPPLLKQTLKVT